jgi:hypothetical protein
MITVQHYFSTLQIKKLLTITFLNNFIYSNKALTENVFRNNFKENILFLFTVETCGK